MFNFNSLCTKKYSPLFLIITQLVVMAKYSYASSENLQIGSDERYDVSFNDIYGGTRLGIVEYLNTCGDLALECENNDVAYGFFLGYDFNYWLGMEASLTNYGDVEADYFFGNVSARLLGSDLSIKISHKLVEQLTGYLKLGASYLHVEKSTSPTNLEQSDRSWVPSVAIGLNYPINKQWSLLAEYQYLRSVGDSNTTGVADVGFASIGIKYNFSGNLSDPDTDLDSLDYLNVHPSSKASNSEVQNFSPIEMTVYFDFDSSKIKDDSTLLKIVELYSNGYGDYIDLFGFSDTRGPSEYNYQLSSKRAESVKHYLTSMGIPAKRINSYAKGELNSNPEYRLNRKVSVYIRKFSDM